MNLSLISKLVYKDIKKTINVSKCAMHEPYFTSSEISHVRNCVKSSYVSTYGTFVKLFEKRISNYTKSKNVICFNSGTSALQIALRVIGVQKNTHVIIPSLSYVAVANAVMYNQAQPFFIDSDLNNLGMCPNSLEKTLNKIVTFKRGKPYNKKTGLLISAIVPVHVFGFPANIEKIIKIGKKFKIPVIEDAADSFGSKFKERHTGTFGLAGIYSFNGNKPITSGAGGALVTNNRNLYKKALHLASIAKKKHQWKFFHNEVGWNYRMSSLNASLGLAQLKKIKIILRKKRALSKKYKKNFKDNPYVECVNEQKDTVNNYWLNTIRIKKNDIKIRDKILNYLNNKGIQSRPVWELLHTLPMYKKFGRANLANAKKLYKTIICLPSSPGLITR